MQLTRDDGDWKIFGINTVTPGVNANVGPIPTLEEATALVTETTRRFAQSVKNDRFEPLYSAASQNLRRDVPEEKMVSTFASYATEDEYLATVLSVDPYLTSRPQLGDDKSLLLEGFYARP